MLQRTSFSRRRVGLEFLGFRLVDEKTGRSFFGTHSLRRGGAQALVAAGWDLDAIKCFGRLFFEAAELYALQAVQSPTRRHGADLSKYMSGVRSLRGFPAFFPGSLPARQVTTFRPSFSLRACLFACGFPLQLLFLRISRWNNSRRICASRRRHPSRESFMLRLFLFSQISVQYLQFFVCFRGGMAPDLHDALFCDTDLSKHEEQDLGVLVCFSADLPLYVINLRVVGYSTSK